MSFNTMWYAIKTKDGFRCINGEIATPHQIANAKFSAWSLDELYKLLDDYHNDFNQIIEETIKGKD